MGKARSWLTKAIRQHPELINQPNVLGQTALHLSVHWPEGLKYLLEAGANVDAMDHRGLTPIFYAASLALHESMNVLAEKNCVLYTITKSLLESVVQAEKDCVLYTSTKSLLESVVQRVREYRSFDPKAPKKEVQVVLTTVIKLVAERRRKLEVLARTFLDAKSVQSLRLSPEAVLDREASHAISMLRKKRILRIDLENLTVEHGTVYHMRSITKDMAQDLWDAGFRGTDEIDQWGLSPLMILNRSGGYNDEVVVDRWELATWLVAKGANPHRRQERVFQQRYEDGRPYKVGYLSDKGSSTTALHYLADELGRGLKMDVTFPPEKHHNIRFLSRLEGRISEQGRRLILFILSEPLPDSCKCACSTMGCRGYTMAVKRPLQEESKNTWYSIEQAQEEILQVSQAIAQYLNIDQPSLVWLRSEMIRFNTFEKLDLRHTCCKFIYAPGPRRFVICEPYDDEEIHEIQEEQAEQLERLETLLVEFEGKYEESNSTFNEFLEGYWTDRMKEVLSEEGPVDHEALKNMGIVLRKEDSPSPCASDDESSSQASDRDSLPFQPFDDAVEELGELYE